MVKGKREENIERGKELFEKELKKHRISAHQILKQELIDSAFKKYNFNGIDEVYAAIGLDAITSRKVITRLKEEYRKTLPVEEQNIISNEKQKSKEKPKKDGYNIETGVIVKGIENCLVRLSRCCNPVPGDDIIGYITRVGVYRFIEKIV